MPNYDYRCPKCAAKAIAFRKYDERHSGPACEAQGCDGVTEYQISAPALKDYLGSHKDEYTKYGPRK